MMLNGFGRMSRVRIWIARDGDRCFGSGKIEPNKKPPIDDGLAQLNYADDLF
jgi:hypothetical protein